MKRKESRPQILRLRAEGAALRMTSGGDNPMGAESVPGCSPFRPFSLRIPERRVMEVPNSPTGLLTAAAEHCRCRCNSDTDADVG